MIVVLVNMVLVLLGSAAGLLLKSRFSDNLGRAVMTGIGLCTMGIGMGALLGSENTLCVICCMVVGIFLGEWMNVEQKMDAAGAFLRSKLERGGESGRFVEGFITATILYCVGAMSVNGSIAAGLYHDYSIILSKSVMDGISAITLSASMGIGVAFSVIPILVYQGGLTLLAGWIGPYLSAETVTEMSAVGGAIIVGISLNLLGATREKIKVGNMLPALFLPILYVPLVNWLSWLIGG